MKRLVLAVLLTGTFLSSMAVLASNWSTKVTATPNGEFTASLIHKVEPAQNETVGTFKSKKEARRAAKAAKKDKDSVVSADCGVVGQPPCE